MFWFPLVGAGWLVGAGGGGGALRAISAASTLLVSMGAPFAARVLTKRRMREAVLVVSCMLAVLISLFGLVEVW